MIFELSEAIKEEVGWAVQDISHPVVVGGGHGLEWMSRRTGVQGPRERTDSKMYVYDVGVSRRTFSSVDTHIPKLSTASPRRNKAMP